MVTKQTEPDVDSWKDQERRQRKANRNKKLGAIAVAAAIAVVAVAWIVGTRGWQDTTTPANPPTVTPTPKEVATDFVEAFGAFDADRAISYLADDADLLPFMTHVGIRDAEGTLDEFRLLVSSWQAQGYKQMFDSCEELESARPGDPAALDTQVRCTFDFHNLGSDEIGLGPYGGSYFFLNVRDGEIIRASQHWDVTEFAPEVWRPFRRLGSHQLPGGRRGDVPRRDPRGAAHRGVDPALGAAQAPVRGGSEAGERVAHLDAESPVHPGGRPKVGPLGRRREPEQSIPPPFGEPASHGEPGMS